MLGLVLLQDHVYFLLLGDLYEVAGCHDFELRGLQEVVVDAFEGFLVLEGRDKQHAVGPASLQCRRIDVDELGGHECQFRWVLSLVVLRERPLCRVDGLVISLPEGVHELQIHEIRLVEDGDAPVLIFGQEVKIGIFCDGIDLVGVPDAVLELYDGILDH